MRQGVAVTMLRWIEITTKLEIWLVFIILKASNLKYENLSHAQGSEPRSQSNTRAEFLVKVPFKIFFLCCSSKSQSFSVQSVRPLSPKPLKPLTFKFQMKCKCPWKNTNQWLKTPLVPERDIRSWRRNTYSTGVNSGRCVNHSCLRGGCEVQLCPWRAS